MTTSLAFIVILITCIQIIFGENSVPYINFNSIPVPGKPFVPASSPEPGVIIYEYKYRPGFYWISTKFADGSYHRAKSHLKYANRTLFYVEEGRYAKRDPEVFAYHIDYRSDHNGYCELSKRPGILKNPRVSIRAIGSIVG